MTRFSRQAKETLRRDGWYLARQVPEMVALWKRTLLLSEGIEMFSSAESVLLEFGGLIIDQQSSEVTYVREPFTFEPAAVYEGDRFSNFSTMLRTRLYPLGEASGAIIFGQGKRRSLTVNERSHPAQKHNRGCS